MPIDRLESLICKPPISFAKMLITFFLLSCAINYGIITVIMKKDGIRFKNAL